MATFREDWTPEQISRFWDHYATRASAEEDYFSNRFGRGIVGLGLRHGMFASGSTVLDYGCGPGHLAPHLLRAGCQVTGYDSSAASTDRANRAIEHPLWKGASTVLPAGPYDAAVCIETIEHLDDDALSGVLAELREALTPGGSVLLTTPNEENLADNATYCPFCDSEFHNMQHIRSWSSQSLRRRLEESGLEVAFCDALHLDATAPFHWPEKWNRAGVRRSLRQIRRLRAGSNPHLCAVGRRPLN